jgi:hypothetical protein
MIERHDPHPRRAHAAADHAILLEHFDIATGAAQNPGAR